MVRNDSTPSTDLHADADAARPTPDEDRYCGACSAIALAYDPAAGRARCRSCGTLS